MDDCIVFDDAGNSFKMKIKEGSQVLSNEDENTGHVDHRRIKAFLHNDGNEYLVAHFMSRSLNDHEIKSAIIQHNPEPYVK
ncbi:hypothetical protein [Pantoea sp. CCBC3-3-1]|uniref:hypothetical protein n=1 Tax=Pantoea sp. CCBC3-3-1 TaxID=2490851 RepID=UPI0011BEAB32|nr:hypothetical protein [Pantoea sp. CCBC3-3-1]